MGKVLLIQGDGMG